MGTLLFLAQLLIPAACTVVLFRPIWTDTAHLIGENGEEMTKYIHRSPIERLGAGGYAWIFLLYLALAAALIVTAILRKTGRCPAWINITVFVLAAVTFAAAMLLSAGQMVTY